MHLKMPFLVQNITTIEQYNTHEHYKNSQLFLIGKVVKMTQKNDNVQLDQWLI